MSSTYSSIPSFLKIFKNLSLNSLDCFLSGPHLYRTYRRQWFHLPCTYPSPVRKIPWQLCLGAHSPNPPSLTQGLFSGRNDGTQITCTDRSPNGLVVAAGDGFSRVRLYRYPCPGDRPPLALFHELRGHGAGGVSRARFLRGGGVLVTVGGSDRYNVRGA